VAIGSCACTGLPSASRNQFTDEMLNERINWYMNNFDYSKQVRKLEDVISVDDKVPGCPMNTQTFIEILTKYLKICIPEK
jgi:coenzyme F420-reducing hydrogenase gamma subunit